MPSELTQSAGVARGARDESCTRPGARRRVRVLAFMEAYSVTGPAKNMIEFARRAAAYPPNEGAEICFVTFVRGATGEDNAFVHEVRNCGLEARVVSERAAFDVTVLGKIRKIIRDFNPDIIQTHNVKSHFLIWLTREFRRYPWIAFQHGYTWTNLKMRTYNQLDRISLPAARKVVTVCKPFAEALARTGVESDRIVVRHNSVKPFRGSAPEVVEDLRRTLGISDDAVVLLAVGRLSSEKGHSDLIRAVASLQQEASKQKIALVVVGDGLERGKLQSLAVELNLQNTVIFAGQQADVAPYYTIADIVVLPSHTEGSPNVLLEAMSAGKAIVATAVGGVPEIARDGENALLVPSRNPDELCRGIRRLVVDSGLRERLGVAARDKSREYDPECYCSSILQVYGSVVGERQLMPEVPCASPS